MCIIKYSTIVYKHNIEKMIHFVMAVHMFSYVSPPFPSHFGRGKPPDGANWVVAEAHPQGRRLAFRLVTAAELFPRASTQRWRSYTVGLDD
jgi:hypothetical protein